MRIFGVLAPIVRNISRSCGKNSRVCAKCVVERVRMTRLVRWKGVDCHLGENVAEWQHRLRQTTKPKNCFQKSNMNIYGDDITFYEYIIC